MRILAIETSCDDTGIAILEADSSGSFKVLANVIASQIKVHQKYGGVYPAMAKREHQKNLTPVLIDALKQAKLLNQKLKIKSSKFKKIEKILEREPELFKKIIPFLKKYGKPDAAGPDGGGIDLIAITNGPGLEPCLWVGVNFAKAISYFWDIPIVAVNHIESHILVNYLNKKEIKLPAIALVVSGGHTQIILMSGTGKYTILGETRDDAAGECFDKAAKILGLGYPGGPIISKLAENIEPKGTLPRPMISTKDYDFSFSGLKTAVLYAWQKIKKENSEFFGSSQKTHQLQAEFSAEVQQAIIDVLLKKTIKAARDYKAKTIILGGGVSANHELKTQMLIKIKEEMPNTEFLFPEIDHSTDNGLMTAIAGYFHKTKKIVWQKLEAKSNLRIS